MNRKKIILGLGILTFLIGFAFISTACYFLNMRVGMDNPLNIEFIQVMGLWSFLGLAIEAVGFVVILLTKFEK